MSHPVSTQDVTEPMLPEDDYDKEKEAENMRAADAYYRAHEAEYNKPLPYFDPVTKELIKPKTKKRIASEAAVTTIMAKEVTPAYETDIKQLVERETLNRQVLTEYITKHMKSGVDYGKIANFPKDVLFKPGSEKFCSLMRLRVAFHRDNETFEMAGSTPGLFCYKAVLINHVGEIVGEGRGACSIQEKKNANTAIKIALKRAQIDAVLRTGGLSDFFTQDLEDMHETEKADVLDVFNEPKQEVEQVPFDDAGQLVEPTCPKCNAAMRKRKSARGEFWGCSTYPKCRGTREV